MSGNTEKFARDLRGLVLIPAAFLLSQCDRKPVEPEPARPIPAASAPEPALTPPAAMNRAEMLAAVAGAASAYAAGERPTGADALVGRTFSIRIPFGCGQPGVASPAVGPTDGLPHATWGKDRETIDLSLAPANWLGAAMITEGDADWEAVEGFWLPQPWLTAETCPATGLIPPAGASVTPSPQTVGLAAGFSSEDSRIGRRNGRAYVFTIRHTGDSPMAANPRGYRLVLEGRLTAFADGRAIRCRADGPAQRPTCIVAVRLDRVAFTNAGDLLSEWRTG